MNVAAGIEELKSIGLNIFLSAKVSTLPKNIYSFRNNQLDKTICLIGAGGPTLWKHLPQPHQGHHPIDDYSIKNVKIFAEQYLNGDSEFLFPNDSVLFPLQRLGRSLGLSHPTPSGIDLCQDFGLWFAYRAVFLTSHDLTITPPQSFQSPCEPCEEKLCLVDRLHCPIKKDEQYSPAQIYYHALQSSLIRC